MVTSGNSFADTFAAWARGQAAVKAVVLIGSHTRAAGEANAADAASDWDFQVITTKPRLFADRQWTRQLPEAAGRLLAYQVRPTFGGVQKVTALFDGAEADLVVLPALQLRLGRVATALGLHRRPGPLRKGLADLAIVVRPGFRFLKGGAGWESFYRRVLREVPDPRLGDAEAAGLAEGFLCDVVWTRRKLARGEALAAQRMLHQSLAETNFRLLHELKLRRGETSYPEARRMEKVATPEEWRAVAINVAPEVAALRGEVERALATMLDLMKRLVPDWRAPDVLVRGDA